MNFVTDILMHYARKADDEVALLLSSGVDSSSVLFSLLEAGKKVTAYSFCLDDRDSKDVVYAEITAKEFGVPFVRVDLPTAIEFLYTDLITLITMGATKKTDIECGWPMLYTYPVIKERQIYSGIGADGHFCISKKGMIHYKEQIDWFRNQLFSSSTYGQAHMHKNFCKVHDKEWVAPYMSEKMINKFMGKSWDEVNKPKQKQPILDSFPKQFKRIKIFPHTNYQLGDSGIAKHFEKLVDTELNFNNHKSVVGIYNNLVKTIGGSYGTMDI